MATSLNFLIEKLEKGRSCDILVGAMKILLVTDSYWPNHDGGAVFEHRLALALAEKGHDVRIITPGFSFLRNEVECDCKTKIYRARSVVNIFNTKYRISLWPFFYMKQVCKEFQPEVVHIHNAALMGLAALRQAKKRHIPVVATNHFMPENLFNVFRFLGLSDVINKVVGRVVWRYLVWFHNKADVVTSPTQTAVDYLVKRGLHAPHQAISNGVGVEKFFPAPDQKQLLRAYFHLPIEKPIVLYAGRLDAEKRLDIWIDAIPFVLKQIDAQFVLAGYGKDRKLLEKRIKKLGVGDHVTFLGRVSDEDFPKIYRIADVFAISSPAELQSIVTLEALASGLPVVATNVAALPEIVHDHENGFLFAYRDFEGMATCIVQILKNPGLRDSFGKASLEIIKQHCDKNSYSQFEELFKTIIKQKK